MGYVDPRCCSVVESWDCDVPANLIREFGDELNAKLTKCYQCGEDVCRPCSKVVRRRGFSRESGRHYIQRVRLCYNCIDENDRFEALEAERR